MFYRPQPRTPQVTMFDWRGLEVNVLHASPGLQNPDYEIEAAREFKLKHHPDVSILVADPFHLLAKKRSVNRPKDQPHIEVLRRFLEEEIVYCFEQDGSPRDRLGPAQRYLSVTRARAFEEKLARRLIPLARNPPEFRFLVDHAPSAAVADALIDLADLELRDELARIRTKRRLR